METTRRSFLTGLFGTAVVAAAGPIPKALEALPETDFVGAIEAALNDFNREIWGDDKGNYAFAKLTYLDGPPWFKITPPEGFRPLREESDRISAEAIARIRGER